MDTLIIFHETHSYLPVCGEFLFVYNSIFIYFMVTLSGRVVSNSPKFEMIVLFLHHFIPPATAAMNNNMRLSPILYYYFI